VFRRNHQRALDSMQASLEAEARGKAEAMRMKKKMEQDLNELEATLDSANRGRAEADKTIKKLQQQMREQQQQVLYHPLMRCLLMHAVYSVIVGIIALTCKSTGLSEKVKVSE